VVVAVPHAETDTVTDTEPEEQGDAEAHAEDDAEPHEEGDAEAVRHEDAQLEGDREKEGEALDVPLREGEGDTEPQLEGDREKVGEALDVALCEGEGDTEPQLLPECVIEPLPVDVGDAEAHADAEREYVPVALDEAQREGERVKEGEDVGVRERKVAVVVEERAALLLGRPLELSEREIEGEDEEEGQAVSVGGSGVGCPTQDSNRRGNRRRVGLMTAITARTKIFYQALARGGGGCFNFSDSLGGCALALPRRAS
jgi:hypothetical protein